MKFKFGDKVQVTKGKFHKGVVGTVVSFIREEDNDYSRGRRYCVLLEHEQMIHAHHSWLEKVEKINQLSQ